MSFPFHANTACNLKKPALQLDLKTSC